MTARTRCRTPGSLCPLVSRKCLVVLEPLHLLRPRRRGAVAPLLLGSQPLEVREIASEARLMPLYLEEHRTTALLRDVLVPWQLTGPLQV